MTFYVSPLVPIWERYFSSARLRVECVFFSFHLCSIENELSRTTWVLWDNNDESSLISFFSLCTELCVVVLLTLHVEQWSPLRTKTRREIKIRKRMTRKTEFEITRSTNGELLNWELITVEWEKHSLRQRRCCVGEPLISNFASRLAKRLLKNEECRVFPPDINFDCPSWSSFIKLPVEKRSFFPTKEEKNPSSLSIA